MRWVIQTAVWLFGWFTWRGFSWAEAGDVADEVLGRPAGRAGGPGGPAA